ncbi:hypothetical protein VL04_12410 [Chromobacterium violaceum]|uniref:glycosyltransferase family 2 protein n=1 Tax=Chromobacterium violaceum TaxID=536 RepID=UPI000654778F|nr:glycosyltransferase family A protein [Chromobacterium violaceum]KMN48107.1 hypothetical protein VK93_17830 [Chromobacterium violaceum]KMN86498.1 hypothetical protein VL02_08835 [Chromobacterium violaceum]KMN89981.1 hypothetical protein VL04_12410 [Chromobacterium violaceum]KMO02105.1 hypothetical protein VL16_20465 [Chromobacterium violaceum]
MLDTISVIIPCFNAEKFIGNALLSIYEQTKRPLEVICVDDKSTDLTINVIASFQEHLSDLEIILIESSVNAGPAVARNYGRKFAKGKWIAFLDADDTWHPQKLELQLDALIKHSLVFIGSAFSYTATSNHIYSCDIKKISVSNLLLKNYFPTPSVMALNEVLIPFDESMRYSEDYACWLLMAKHGYKMGYIPTPLTFLGKPSYGHSGLSANLVQMEYGELRAIRKCLGQLNGKAIFFQAFSILKFIKRIAIVTIRRLVN